MGASESVVVGALEEIQANISQSSPEISEEITEKCRALWSSLPSESKTKIGLCACSRRSDHNPKKQDIIVPEILTSAIGQWIEQPHMFFHKSGSRLDLHVSKSPTKDIQRYAEQLGAEENGVLDIFRERFVKIILMKLKDIGQIAEEISTTVAHGGKIDLAQYICEGRRLYGLCRDIGKRQENLNHAELGNLFALPQYASTEFIRRIPQRSDKRQSYIEDIKRCGALELEKRADLEKLANAIMVTMWEPIEQRLAPSCTVLRMQDPRCNKPQNKRTSKSGSCRKVSRIRKTKPPEKQRNPNFASQINPASDFHESPDQIFPGIIMQENSQHTESQMELSIAHEELQATQEIFTYENPLPVNRTQDLQLPRDASRNVSRSDICYDPRPQHSHTSYEYRGNMVSSEKDQPQTSREMVSDGLTSLDSTFHESTGFSSNAHGQAVEPSLALGNMASPEFDELIRLNMHQGGVPVPDVFLDFHNPTGFSNAHGQAVEPSLALGNMASPEFDELIRLNMHQGGVPVPDVTLGFHNPTGFSNTHGQAVEPSLALGNMASPEFDELIRLNMHQGGVPVPDVTLGFHNPTGFSNTHGQAVEPSLAPGNMPSPELDELIRLNMHQSGALVQDTSVRFHNPTNIAFPIPHSQTIENPSPSTEPIICSA